MVLEFLQEWLLQIVTTVSVIYLIRLSKTRRRTEILTMIKVDAIAYALGKTSVGDDFMHHYTCEVNSKVEEAKFKEV